MNLHDEIKQSLTPTTPKDWDNWSIERQLGYDMAWRDIQDQATAALEELVKREVLKAREKDAMAAFRHMEGLADDLKGRTKP